MNEKRLIGALEDLNDNLVGIQRRLRQIDITLVVATLIMVILVVAFIIT